MLWVTKKFDDEIKVDGFEPASCCVIFENIVSPFNAVVWNFKVVVDVVCKLILPTELNLYTHHLFLS